MLLNSGSRGRGNGKYGLKLPNEMISHAEILLSDAPNHVLEVLN